MAALPRAGIAGDAGWRSRHPVPRHQFIVAFPWPAVEQGCRAAISAGDGIRTARPVNLGHREFREEPAPGGIDGRCRGARRAECALPTALAAARVPIGEVTRFASTTAK